jgi:hypothetical protein
VEIASFAELPLDLHQSGVQGLGFTLVGIFFGFLFFHFLFVYFLFFVAAHTFLAK